MNSDEFSESRGVIVSDCSCISERFQHRVRLYDLILKSDLLLAFRLLYVNCFLLRCADCCEIRNYL
uniref:Uncharacterized protein n=1 Tax=Parascaris univalens TaxID=6257 RepID=A0A915CIT7_PARUN